MKKMISPSLMCGRIANYPHTLDVFAKTGIEYLHVDVMDGDFVPNLQFGTDTVRQLRGMSNIPLDIHLMIERPEDKLAWFDIQPGEYVSVHAESTKHLQKCLAMIRERGGKPMAAINPATPFLMLENVLGDLDGILVMTVNPGFAGQKLIPATLEKVRELRVYLDARGYTETDIEVDGNVSFENARLLADAGANIFVAGTSSVYKRDLRLEDAIAQMRKSIE
ncbi:MAG: ribulose-phosphate 3-epimerase [Clostridia bacterium]|nr:ribulose-phosphate 3-epimerase [Clostridia bacterium]